jgi:hypothetical protein
LSAPVDFRDSLRLPRAAVGLALFCATAMWFYAGQPLHHTDLWGHLVYGRLISAARGLPATEPFMPLAAGTPIVDTAWLWQVVAYQTHAAWGAAGLQLVHGATIGLSFLVLSWTVYRLTGGFVYTAIGLVLFELLNFYQFQIARPQIAGLACFNFVVSILTRRRNSWRDLLSIPLVFALWANLHGSFVIGLALLICGTIGSAIDVRRKSLRPESVVRDRRFRRLAAITALAGLSTLANPYGAKLYAEIPAVARNPNLQDLVEWQRLNFQTNQGRMFAITAAALCVTYLFARRRVSAGEILALVLFAAATVWSARLLVWWTPLAAPALAVNCRAIVRRLSREKSPERPASRSWAWTTLSLTCLGIGFFASPPNSAAFTGERRPLSTAFSDGTPVAAVDWLSRHPQSGQVFNPCEWGDYLIWAGPPHLQIFVDSHAHLVPGQVWRDYMTVAYAREGWKRILDQYQVTTIVVDLAERGKLVAELKHDANWHIEYADDRAVVFSRHDSRFPGEHDAIENVRNRHNPNLGE